MDQYFFNMHFLFSLINFQINFRIAMINKCLASSQNESDVANYIGICIVFSQYI